MQRTSRTLFSQHLDPAPPPDSESSMYGRRVECMIDYYYYKGRTSGKEYQQLLLTVSDAFFLSLRRIHDTIQANRDTLVALRQDWKDKPTDKLQRHLRDKWPHLVW